MAEDQDIQQYLLQRGPAQIELTFIYAIIGDDEYEDFETAEEMIKATPFSIHKAIKEVWSNNWPDEIHYGKSTIKAKHPENVTSPAERLPIEFTDIEIIKMKIISEDEVSIKMKAKVNDLSNLVGNINAWRLEGDTSVKLKVL